MTCTRCHREISDEASYCQFCGAGQRQGASASLFPKPLRRSQADRKLAGICGGIARYLDTDPVFIRVAWVILSIVPGSILLGVLAYVVAWIIVPEAEPGSEPMVVGAKRMQRSAANVTVAGVCGGIAEYFAVDRDRDAHPVGPALHLPRFRDLRSVRLRGGLVHHAGSDGDTGHGSAPRPRRPPPPRTRRRPPARSSDRGRRAGPAVCSTAT